MTVIGRPASFRVGGRSPTQGPGKAPIPTEYGTHVDLLPILADDGTIKLELRAQHSEFDYKHSRTIDGQVVPRVISREIDTSAKLSPGQTLVVGGFVGKRLRAKNPVESSPPDDTDISSDPVELIVLASIVFVDAMELSETNDGGHQRGAAAHAEIRVRRYKR